jgi:hypothetical protein
LKDVDAVRRAVGDPLRVAPDIEVSDLERRINYARQRAQ